MKHYDHTGKALPPHAPFAPSQFAPAPVPSSMGTRKAECRLCSAPILFIQMEGSKKPMPCDPTQIYGDGRKHLVVRKDVGGKLLGQLITRAGSNDLGYEPHWGTCPVYREQQRRQRAKAVKPPKKRKRKKSGDVDLFTAPEDHRAVVRPADQLTERERVILEELARGHATQGALAYDLDLSVVAVATDVWHMADPRRFVNPLVWRDPALRDISGDVLLRITDAGREALTTLT